jgi:beta-N-acetylhexosaminidase
VAQIDSIAAEAIRQRATPGCVVAVAHRGKLVFRKAYGHLTYDSGVVTDVSTIYDLASVTKISATTLCVMKLYEQGKIDLSAPIGQYLPWLRGTDKAELLVENLLLHQAGLNAFIPFYKALTLPSGLANPQWLQPTRGGAFTKPVTEGLYLHQNWGDTLLQRIATSALAHEPLKYVYSDNDFILLGKIVEAVAHTSLDSFATQQFYQPLCLRQTGYKPYERFALSGIAPTEAEASFRSQLLWGTTHDPGAALMGNVAGHAGLFSSATDLLVLYQMLLNGGKVNGKIYLKPATIQKFTAYQSPISRRGLGFDKPEKDNAWRAPEKAYPSPSVSGSTFGHTGYTGTCVWVDPAKQLVYVFLSNRVHPSGGENTKLLQLNIRSRIQEAIYAGLATPSGAGTPGLNGGRNPK